MTTGTKDILSGPISISNIQAQFGGPGKSLSAYYSGGAYVPAGTSGINGVIPTSGKIGISDFYGAPRAYFTPLKDVTWVAYTVSTNTGNSALCWFQISGSGSAICRYGFGHGASNVIVDSSSYYVPPNDPAAITYWVRATPQIGVNVPMPGGDSTLTSETNNGLADDLTGVWLSLSAGRQWGCLAISNRIAHIAMRAMSLKIEISPDNTGSTILSTSIYTAVSIVDNGA